MSPRRSYSPAPAGALGATGGEATYEWNVRHAGFDETPPLERLMLTGDENLVEVAARVHYRVADAAAFATADPALLVEASAERSLRAVLAAHTLDAVLTGKVAVQQSVQAASQGLFDRFETGATVLSVSLEGVSPPSPVREAFNDVASARRTRSARHR